MMKNSKLSKLLVAGVSVAVLASAFAPMAFAEESEVTDAAKLTVTFMAPVEAGKFVNARTGLKDVGSGTDNFEYIDKRYVNDSDVVSLESFEAKSYATEMNTFIDFNANGKQDNGDILFKGTETVKEIQQTLKDNGKAESAVTISYSFKIGDYENVKVIFSTHDETKYSHDYTTDWGDFGTTYAEATATTGFLFDADKTDVKLPALLPVTNQAFKEWKIEISKNGTTYEEVAPLKNGEVLDLTKYSYKYDTATSTKHTIGYIKVTPRFDSTEKKYKLVIEQNASIKVSSSTTINVALKGLTYNDDLTLKAYANTSPTDFVSVPVNLPTVTTDDVKAKGWTFDHWAIKNDVKLSDGTTSAKDKAISVFDPSDYKASADETVTLYAVFTKGETPDPVVVYSGVKTPNDTNTTVVKYVNGVVTEFAGTVGDDMKFDKGLFYNQVDETFVYYLPKNSVGRWELDTTVDGLKDGVYFADGKQDTEAYGLKKVSGAAEDDKFFYLVSDGLYVDDYTGIWVDEDGSIYNLINGCTSDVPFTGIVEKDGWATSVKDSMVDNKANGFILYGDTQYWFINGTCNLNETEAVRQHTDGNFYYTVGAKIDFTFNGECNGHTFVNGVASK